MSTNLTKNFYKNEFMCKHCGQYEDSLHIAKQNQAFRDYLCEQEGRDISLTVHCGCRCTQHNTKVGGVKGSYHLPPKYRLRKGASDMHSRQLPNWKLRRYAKKAYKLGIIRGGLGLYRWGIHLDCGPKRRWGHFWSK